VDRVFAKIRNITLRTMPDGSLFPVEISQYDPWVFREAVHNAIAHQDYRLCKSIAVTEFPDRLVIANAGAFLPGSLDAALESQTRPRHYPNAALAEAMVELKMIDTIGSGIRRMFMTQRKRFMPMPDYELQSEEVSVTLPGCIFDSKYTQLLIRRSDLPLADIILLDRLQKGARLGKEAVADLRKKGLVEGRYPNVFPAGEVAAVGGKTAEYIEAKAFDDDFYMHKILQFICQRGAVTREDIEKIISKHLSSTMSESQRRNKIGNLLSVSMRKNRNWIKNTGGQGHSSWSLTTDGLLECRRVNPKCRRRCHQKL
jgi:ATP-dependent DNA helicase RecG